MTDWWVLNDERVIRVAERAARNIVVEHAESLIEEADLCQDALMLVATTPALAMRAENEEWGYLFHELRMDLFDKFIRPMSRSGELLIRKHAMVSLNGHEADNDLEDEDRPATGPVYRQLTEAQCLCGFVIKSGGWDIPLETWETCENCGLRVDCTEVVAYGTRESVFEDNTNDYSLEITQAIIPAIWDESYAYGMPAMDTAPEQGMPRAASNKARANTHWAYIVDIKTAWAMAPLNVKERRAIFLRHAMGWTVRDIAINQGAAPSMIHKRIAAGEKKLAACLNGGYWNNEEY